MSSSKFKLNLAVIVGINNYQNGIPALGTARQDAEAVANLLETKYQYQVHLITDSQATSDNLKQWLKTELPEVTKKDTPSRLLFYFAGHGIALNGEDGPQGYLIPQDAKLGDVYTYIPMQQVEVALTQLSCRHCLVILDCCFAGAFRWSSTRKLIPITKTIHKERYDRFIQDSAWQVITSAASDQYALDNLALKGDRGIAKNDTNHSPFAAVLMEALSGSADVYPPAINGKSAGDGVITATELYMYLRDAVEIPTDAKNQRQTPQIWCLKKHDKGEFIFLPPGHKLNLPPAPSLDELEDNNPYRGLKSYETKDSGLFFGRTTLIEKLCDIISDRPFTVVLGASGSGKSSLVKAGLISHLEKSRQIKQSQNRRLKPQEHSHQCQYQVWKILTPIRPGELPLSSLNSALKELGIVETNHLDSKIFTEEIIAWSQTHPETRLLLVIDQLEELITLCYHEQERQQFLELLAALLKAHPDVLHLVVTLRSDFEPQFRSTPLESLWQDARFVVPAMTRDELRAVIEEPASAKVVYFESLDNRGYLVDRLIDEVAGMPGSLPLLSFALSELYLKLARRYLVAQIDGETVEREITWADYDELGGVTKSLTRRADEEYEELVKVAPAYERTIRYVMLRMVAVGGELARRQVLESELRYPEPENRRVREVINRFSAARLLVGGTDTDNNPYIEPAHDALVRGWEKIILWLKERQVSPLPVQKFAPLLEIRLSLSRLINKSEINQVNFRESEAPLKINLLLQRELTTAANNWWSEKKQAGFLWDDDPRLPLLVEIDRTEDNWLNEKERDFVRQSITRKRRNKALLWGTVGVVTLGSIIFSISVWTQWKNSELNRANSLGRYSLSLSSGEQELEAFIEAIRGGQILQKQRANDPEVLTALYEVFQKKRHEYNRYIGHEGEILSVAITPDGKTLVSDSADRTIKVWNLERGGKPLTLTGHEGQVHSVAITPDGKTLVAANNEERSIKIWNLEKGEEPRTLINHEADIHSVAITPDSKTVVSGDDDNIIKIWNLEKGGEPRTLIGHEREVNSVVITPDGKTVISGSADYTVKVWNLEKGGEPRTLIGHKSIITTVAITPDGKTVVSGSWDKTIKVWNLERGGEPLTLSGHQDTVNSVTITPDGKTVVSGSFDNTIKVWNLEKKEELLTLNSHQYIVHGVAITPDGKTVVSGGADNTIKVWKLEQKEEPLTLSGHQDTVNSVTITPDGKTLVSGSTDSIKVWNLEQGGEPLTLTEAQSSFSSIDITPDGKTLVSGSYEQTLNSDRTLDSLFQLPNYTIKIWNLEQGRKFRTLTSDQGNINSIAITPNGKTVVASSSDRTLISEEPKYTIKVWNLERKEEPLTLSGHQDTVNSVAITPDGKTLVSGSRDTIKVWNIKGEREPRTLIGYEGEVRSLTITPDGKTVVASSYDNTIKVWKLEQKEEPRTLLGPQAGIDFSVAITPDGKTLVSGSHDTIKVWKLEQGGEPRTLTEAQSSFDSIAITPDGKTVVASSSDQTSATRRPNYTIKVWNLAQEGSLLTLTGHQGNINSVAITPDGKTVVSGSHDRTIKVWDLDLDSLMKRSCQWVWAYLHNPYANNLSESDRHLCDDISPE